MGKEEHIDILCLEIVAWSLVITQIAGDKGETYESGTPSLF